MSGQLTLSIFGGPRFAAADFHAAPSNADACAWLRRTAEWPNRRLALWGEAGRGKTHLLHIWAERTGAALRDGRWTVRSAGHAARPAVALDDADVVAEERALLHLLNAAGEAGVPVLLAARHRRPAGRWRLPDLASRLRAITAVEIGPPEDALLRALLARLLADRQLRAAGTGAGLAAAAPAAQRRRAARGRRTAGCRVARCSTAASPCRSPAKVLADLSAGAG